MSTWPEIILKNFILDANIQGMTLETVVAIYATSIKSNIHNSREK